MAEEANFGVRRLRQAITNQATCGSGQFELSIDSADKLCRECEDELARLAWAEGIPAPVDADGNVVPLGTEKLYTDEGEMIRVASICLNGRLWYVRRAYCDETYWLDELHLAQPDSWEKLEKDVRNAENGGACGYCGRETKSCNEACPANEDLRTPCAAIALKDVLRRAKALAERDGD